MIKPVPRFADFLLLIGEGHNRRFPLDVVESPAGQAEGTMSWPFKKMPDNEPWQDLDQQEFGSRLFDALFSGDIRRCWDLSLGRAEALGQGLRLRLQVSDQMALVPWEILYDTSRHTFLAWDEKTPIVRSPAVMEPCLPLQLSEPLHLLVVLASPSDLPTLDVDKERRLISEALSPLEKAGTLRVTILEKATPQGLKQKLEEEVFHVLHVIAHGASPEESGQGALFLEDSQGVSQPLLAEDLAAWARNHDPLRLVVLNACSTAKEISPRPLSSVAGQLVQAGLPAVVAMQFPISDQAAIAFAQSFYRAVAQGEPVEVAMTRARLQIKLSPETNTEWRTPVLYLRSQESLLFQPVVSAPTVPSSIPRVQQAYAVWSRLFYCPAFLEDPQEPRRGVKDLGRGDPVTIRTDQYREEVRDEYRPTQPREGSRWSPGYVLGVGRLVDGTQSAWSIGELTGVAGCWGHIPYLVEPTWRVELLAPQVPPRTELRWRLRLHLFAYGLVNAMLTLQVRSPDGLNQDDLLTLLRQASPLYAGQAGDFALHTAAGQEKIAKADLLPRLASQTVQGIFGQAVRLEPIHPKPQSSKRQETSWAGERAAYLYLQRVDPPLNPERDLRMVARLVGMTPDWEKANARSLTRFRPLQSLEGEGLGRLEGDWIILGNLSSFLYTPALENARERRHFFWQVLAAAELARAQAVLYRLFADRLTRKWATLYRRQRDHGAWVRGFFRGSGEQPDLVCFWEDLLQFGDRLPGTPAFVGKVYRLVADALNLKDKRERFGERLAKFTTTVASWKSPPQQLLEGLKSVKDLIPIL